MAGEGMSWLVLRLASKLVAPCLALLCFQGIAWPQMATTRCTFSVSPSYARLEAWLTGGNRITIQPGTSIALIPGKWHFQASARDYKTGSWTLSVSGACYTHRFGLDPDTEQPTTTRTPLFVCPTCGDEFSNKAALNKHRLDKHTSVKVVAIEPSDADLRLDGATPIKPGEWIRVTAGSHTITGESPRGYLKDPRAFRVTAGEQKVIDEITVCDNAPPVVKIGKVDPPEARITKITVNGMTETEEGTPIRPGMTVNVKPKGEENPVKVNVTVEAEDYQPWTMPDDVEVKWKETWTTPEVKLVRLRYGTVGLTVNPTEAGGPAKVSLVDKEGRSYPITKPQGERLPPGEYTVKAGAPDYREKNPGSTVTVKDHELASVLVELVRAEGRLKLSFEPKPVASVSVYESGASLGAADDGSYRLSPDIAHSLVFRALGFKDAERSVTLGSNETKSLELKMDPLPGALRLTVEPKDAIVKVTDADGKVVQTDETGTAERTIKLKPGEDGSSRVYHYRVHKDGLRKGLLAQDEDCTGSFTVEPDKTVSVADTIVLKSIKDVLDGTLARDDRTRIIVEDNRPAIKGGFTAEQLEAAAGLAIHSSVKNEIVWGALRWRDMPKYYREKAAGKAK